MECKRKVKSFLFVLSPIPGKFQLEIARELRILPGPMYAQLVQGKAVTFIRRRRDGAGDGEEEEITVKPHEVLEGGARWGHRIFRVLSGKIGAEPDVRIGTGFDRNQRPHPT